MDNKIARSTAYAFSTVFNPFLVPSLGFLVILMNLPGVAAYSGTLKWVLMGIIFFSTCMLPVSFVLLLANTTNIERSLDKRQDRMLPFMFTAIAIFIGAQVVGKLPVPGVFRLALLGQCLIIIMLFLVSTRWKISGHAAAMGGVTGIFMALTFKYAVPLTSYIIASIILSGFIGSSRIMLNKHTPAQVFAGYIASLLIMYVVIYFF